MFLFKKRRMIEISMTDVKSYGKLILYVCLIFFSISYVNAQKGLFLKFSVGSGYTREYSNINSGGHSLVTKNHAIGWGITDKLAVQIGEFGGLNKLKAGDYDYINLDAYGLGFCYKTPIDIKISVIGAYSKVSFANKWSEPEGDDGGNGVGINMSIDKEWFIAKRWGIRLGPQLFWLKTNKTNYKFFNVSLNGSLVFYLTPVR
jgi:hypothetical protein